MINQTKKKYILDIVECEDGEAQWIFVQQFNSYEDMMTYLKLDDNENSYWIEENGYNYHSIEPYRYRIATRNAQQAIQELITTKKIIIVSNQTIDEEIEDLKLSIEDLLDSKKDGKTHVVHGYFKSGTTSIRLAGNVELNKNITEILKQTLGAKKQ